MSTDVIHGQDLPLSANHDEFQVFHHLLDLKCDFYRSVVRGCLVAFIRKGDKWTDSTQLKLVLDCSDIVIESVEEIVEINAIDLDPGNYCWMNSILMKPGRKLSWSMDDWTVTVTDEKNTYRNSFPLVMRFLYTTKADTRSLHWRVDIAGNPCLYTAAASINNRGLFPSQDIPKALATWTAKVSVCSGYQVFCTGDTEPEVQEEDQLRISYFHTNLVLPMSTFALAVGQWQVRNLTCKLPTVRFIGPDSLLDDNAGLVGKYLPASMEAAMEVLGPYPLARCDIVVVHRSFSGLGLASPNLIFLSPSIFSGDPGLFMKISHEVSHAWFGIMIGALDWTEAWISEGFATFMEEIIHDLSLTKMGLKVDRELSALRSLVRYESLVEEVGNTEQDLQLLRPLQGQDLLADDRCYVKNGLNPVAGMTQAHYIKGYFLLHYLLQLCDDREQFFSLLKNYITTYFGQLVSSTHFIDMFYSIFDKNIPVSKSELIKTWLHSPGVPEEIAGLDILNVRRNNLYSEVSEAYAEIYHACHIGRDKKRKADIYLEKFQYSEQLSLLLNLLIRMESIPCSVLRKVKEEYGKQITKHPELGHKWSEIVIKNKFRSEYSFVSHYMKNHQSMGVFLYGELINSKNKTLKMMFKDLVEELKDELDDNSISVIKNLT